MPENLIGSEFQRSIDLDSPPSTPEAHRPVRRPTVRRALALALLSLAAACTDGAAPGEEAPRSAQKDGGDAGDEPVCVIEQKQINLPDGVGESSGVTASRRTPGVFWTHNDSGGEADLFAATADGRGVGRVRVEGAKNEDWEDLADAPCDGGGSCLLIGDIGNNGGKKGPLVLYRVPEPAPGDEATAPAERFTARFPGKRPDAEALVALPDGRIFLITKGTGNDPIDLYRWPTPLRADQEATLERVRELAPSPEQPGDRVTGASASPDGRWVAVRTYSSLAFYRIEDLLGAGEPATTMDLLPLEEGQGEGVYLGPGGMVLLTSENPNGHLPGTAARLTCPLR